MSDSSFSSGNDSSARIASLENQITLLLLLLVALSAPLALYFYRQASDAGKEYAQVNGIETAYKENAQNIQRTVVQLGAFGQTHKDIQPLLQQFGIPVGAPGAVQPIRR
jgi:hypothetical protein